MTVDQNVWETIFVRSEHVVSRKIADEMLLVPIRGNMADMQHIFALNPVAEFIWDRFDESRQLRAICQDIVEEFDVETTRAEADLLDVVEEFDQAGLVVQVSG